MRAVKIALAAVAGVVVLLVVAVVIVAWTFDPNEYKGVATDAFWSPIAKARMERNAKSRGPSTEPPNVPKTPSTPTAPMTVRIAETRTSGSAKSGRFFW